MVLKLGSVFKSFVVFVLIFYKKKHNHKKNNEHKDFLYIISTKTNWHVSFLYDFKKYVQGLEFQFQPPSQSPSTTNPRKKYIILQPKSNIFYKIIQRM